MFSVCTEAIVELGPDLIGAVVPGATFVAALEMYVASKTPWAAKLQKRLDKVGQVGGETINQNQIFEQYLKVLEALSERTPLVLVLDDLQWADTASVGLLFRLGRRIEQSRILVVGVSAKRCLTWSRGRTPPSRGIDQRDETLFRGN
ncbi:MAG: AAA family ATPase [Acidimicrobiia bacterium]